MKERIDDNDEQDAGDDDDDDDDDEDDDDDVDNVALTRSFLSPYPLLQVPISRVISALGLSVPTKCASLIITDAMVKMTVEIKVMV